MRRGAGAVPVLGPHPAGSVGLPDAPSPGSRHHRALRRASALVREALRIGCSPIQTANCRGRAGDSPRGLASRRPVGASSGTVEHDTPHVSVSPPSHSSRRWNTLSSGGKPLVRVRSNLPLRIDWDRSRKRMMPRHAPLKCRVGIHRFRPLLAQSEFRPSVFCLRLRERQRESVADAEGAGGFTTGP